MCNGGDATDAEAGKETKQAASRLCQLLFVKRTCRWETDVPLMDGSVDSGDDDDDGDDFDEHEERRAEELGGTQAASRSITMNEIICATNPSLPTCTCCIPNVR